MAANLASLSSGRGTENVLVCTKKIKKKKEKEKKKLAMEKKTCMPAKGKHE